MITLEWPWALGLAALPLLAQRALAPVAPSGALRLPIAAELRALADVRAARLGRDAALALAAWLLLMLAAAQPRWIGDAVALPVHARDLLLAVDASGSMAEKDVDRSRGGVSRMEAVQQVAGEFLERRDGDRVGLVLFGTQAYLYAPLTLDRGAVATLLAESEVGLAGDGTAIGDAIAIGVRHLRHAAASERVLILLSDGENTAGSVPPATAAELAAANRVRIHTIGFGAVRRNPLLKMLGFEQSSVEEETLRRIARRTGGQFFRAHDTVELRRIYALLDRIEPAQAATRSFQPTRSLFHWPLAAACLLAVALLARRGMLRA